MAKKSSKQAAESIEVALSQTNPKHLYREKSPNYIEAFSNRIDFWTQTDALQLTFSLIRGIKKLDDGEFRIDVSEQAHIAISYEHAVRLANKLMQIILENPQYFPADQIQFRPKTD